MQIEARLKGIREEANGICSFEFHERNGGPLPVFDPGAHIDLYLPTGLVRSYSLCNPSDRTSYVVAVNKDAKSRGGSTYMHQTLRVGAEMKISVPRNNFQLDQTAAHSVFIAGGIGITPILGMVRALSASGKSWELHYGSRSSQAAAFVDELTGLAERTGAKVRFQFGTRPEDPPRLEEICRSAPETAHLYCCGPLGMLSAFEEATRGYSPERVHTEYFSAPEPIAKAGGFAVRLAKSGKVVPVKNGCTILDAILAEGVEVSYSCKEGVCGTCETAVLEGTPDHRDLVLSKSERASNRSMMICCSGSLTAELILDL
ncbi:MAG: PDR/VanB family oxidoreductase [Pseudomonadota bacterium]|nr:PDR/VanB family oxidoreductase [Pseudomonadota bacterium]